VSTLVAVLVVAVVGVMLWGERSSQGARRDAPTGLLIVLGILSHDSAAVNISTETLCRQNAGKASWLWRCVW